MARALLASSGLGLVASSAAAHIEVTSGNGVAGTTQAIVFGVGHGCAGADTVKVVIDLPAGVTSVRPMRSDFGTPTVKKDDSGGITNVVWQKADGDVLPADIAYYALVVRLKLPATPFTTLYFPTHQTCRAADQTTTVVDWATLPTDPVIDGGAQEPAPAVKIVPAHRPGWNKITVPVALDDLGAYFGDAAIVWKGTAAYSANPTTKELIAGTAGVTPLTSVAANDVVWVRY